MPMRFRASYDSGEPWSLLGVEIVMHWKFAFFCMFLSLPVFADGSAPWCLIRDEVERCNFYAADDCYNAVAATGGDCRENFRTAGVTGDRPWCLVTANRKTCNYFSSAGCRAEAERAGGGCVLKNSHSRI